MTEIPIWRIKYLPKDLNEVCGRDEIKRRLKQLVEEKNFPHLLFVGPEGIGKTTIARLFAKEFLGSFFTANSKVVYANVPLTSEEMKLASSEAYVSTSKVGSLAGKKITTPAFIAVKIKPFVQLKVLGDAPFKILIVKHFDSLENNQQAFRRLMEIYGRNCRMILITTKISKIIDPIISRCQIFLLYPTEIEAFKELILEICKNEGLKIEDNILETLYKVTEGVISHAIDLLQLVSISGNIITLDNLYERLISSQKELLRSLLLICFKGDFIKAREISRNIQSKYKYNAQELFNLLLIELKKFPLSKYAKIKLMNLIADADFRATDGLDTDIQISNLLAKICHLSEAL